METYKPLKPPEYRRNERGQFDRPGKTLAKTQKKTGLINKKPSQEIQSLPERHPDGRLKNGGARPGAGRPKGSPNKLSHSLKEMILAALDDVGGKAYLSKLAIENSSAFSSLLGKMVPTTLSADESNGGLGVKMVFERHIVWPDGRREIEGVTPKALPSPDASHALPRPTDPTDDTNEGAV